LNGSTENDALLISYLLGELPEEEKRKLEEEYSIDDNLYEELQAAERDLIDSYVGRELSARERELFENYFLSSPARRQRLRFATALKEYASPVPASARAQEPSRAGWWPRFFLASPWRYALPLVLLLALVPAIFRMSFYESDVSKGLAVFKKAYGQQRPGEFRISGLDYAPVSKARGENRSGVDEASRQGAETRLLKAADENPNSESLHALGQVYLAKGDFDSAIEKFELALKEDPRDARIHSDLGAALLARAKHKPSGDQPGGATVELDRSMESLKKALELDASLPEAIFNLALVYEALNERGQARDEWQRYLDKDPDSGWAEEAKDKLRRVTREK